MIAVTVVAVVMVSIVAAMTVSIRNTVVAKQRAIATKLGQEGMEYFRSQRNFLGWESFYGIVTPYSGKSICLDKNLTITTPLSSLSATPCGANQFADPKQIFQRSASVNALNSNEVDVTVTTTWQDGTLSHNSVLQEAYRKNVN